MKKHFLLAFAFLSFFSCSRDEDDSETPQNQCKIVTAKRHNYLFDDVAISTSSFDVNFNKFTFEYDSQKRINKVIGGLIASSAGDLGGFYLSNTASDEITYSGNTVFVKVSANMGIRPYDKEFVIENGKLLSQKITSKFPVSNNTISTNFSYEYSGNQILEKFNGILNNRLNKTLTVENGNLTKVVKWRYNLDGNINGKTEIIYSDYDKQENLLKDKFFINGAFYSAFSSNIYNKIDSKTYDLLNGTFVFNGNYFNTTYDPASTSNYFEKNCN
ncbi:MAG: hypothetical protein L6262_00340 [Weeksellaceae bacterium]|nr:hypothetical protein [Weeksellaceae bacterium]